MDNAKETNYFQASAMNGGRYKSLFSNPKKQAEGLPHSDTSNVAGAANFYADRSSRLWNHSSSKSHMNSPSPTLDQPSRIRDEAANNTTGRYDAVKPNNASEPRSQNPVFEEDKIESCSDISQTEEGITVISKNVEKVEASITKGNSASSEFAEHIDFYDVISNSKSNSDHTHGSMDKLDRSSSVTSKSAFYEDVNSNNPFKPAASTSSGTSFNKDATIDFKHLKPDVENGSFRGTYNPTNSPILNSAGTQGDQFRDSARSYNNFRNRFGKFDVYTFKSEMNPFIPFVCNLDDDCSLTDLDIDKMKALVLSGAYSDDILVKYFRESTSITSSSRMKQILSFLFLLMRESHKTIPTCIRLMSSALGFHPEEFIDAFRCEYLSALFNPMIDDSVGGEFIQLLLSYKSTFATPGVLEDGMPLSLDDEGQLVYVPDPLGDYDCGKLESLELLRICMDRARVKSAFDLPSSKLRTLVCTLWYEMPATCPKVPMAQLCFHWINSNDESVTKDAVFALLQRMKDSMGSLDGNSWLLSELILFTLRKDCRIHYELETVIEMINSGENLYYALDTIVSKFNEKDMLDLWCLFCSISWPTVSPDRPFCILLSTTLRVFYNVALRRSRSDKVTLDEVISPLSLLENCLRICVCRCLSHLNSLDAILHTLLLIDTDPQSVLTDQVSPLVLRSLCSFLWKCHFLWTRIKEAIHPETLTALVELYKIIQKWVPSPPLSSPPKENHTPRINLMLPRHYNQTLSYHNVISSFIRSREAETPDTDFYDDDQNDCEDFKEIELNPCGLKNLGNTCYYNSLIQALYHTRYFVYSIAKWNLDSKKSSPYTLSLYNVFKKMLTGKKKVVNPHSNFKLLPEIFKDDQQDVTEAIRFISDALDSNLEIWKSVFAGLIVRRIKCLRCESISDNEETLYDFNFAISNLKRVSDLFDNFCKIEVLTGENKYFCSKCNKGRTAHMWNVIASPPSHLIVILNRNNWLTHNNDTQKNLKRIMIDSLLNISGFDYQLYGSIIHSGDSTHSGHYFFIGCDSELFEDWYKFDDSVVKRVDSNMINEISQDPSSTNVPYVLFYRCLQAPQTPKLLI